MKRCGSLYRDCKTGKKDCGGAVGARCNSDKLVYDLVHQDFLHFRRSKVLKLFDLCHKKMDVRSNFVSTVMM